MELGGKKLDEWLLTMEAEGNFSQFPHSENFPSKYRQHSEQLYNWVHEEVSVGSTITDKSVLTNHGKDHIETVIKRATQFVKDNTFCNLTPFEVYVLLLAIHVHDVGNILGRKDHEFNAKKIIEKLSSGVVNQDNIIWDYIYQIAKGHKGMNIETLAQEDYLFEKTIRPQLLAATLKFADELAENFSRGSQINVELGTIPEESMIYHVFAGTVNSIIPLPKSREIKMIFNVTESQLCQKFIKKENGKEVEVYLIDEIYLRTLKTYSEKVYCMKFMRPYINFDVIKVTLNIKMNNEHRVSNGYELAERGIENIHMDEVYRICPELEGKSGEDFHNKIKEQKLN